VFGTKYRLGPAREHLVATSRLSLLKVADLMSVPITIAASVTTREAATLLARARLAAAPVVEADEEYVGVFEEREVHNRLSMAVHGFHSPEEFRTGVPFLAGRFPDSVWRAFGRVGWTPVGVLARPIPPVQPSDSILEAFEVMRRHGLAVIPVVAGGEVVGILQADVLTLRLAEAVPARPG